MGEKWLPVALSYQGPVVRVLGLDQRIQILARRENFASGLCAIKLAAIALYGSQFAFELLADVHHEGRLDWVLSIRERVEQLVGTVRGSSCGISLQAGEVARVPSQFRGHAVIGMTSHGEGKDDEAGREVPDVLDHDAPGLFRVLQVRIR